MQFLQRHAFCVTQPNLLFWAAARGQEVRGQEHDQIIIFLIFAATQEAFSFFNTSLAEVEAMQA